MSLGFFRLAFGSLAHMSASLPTGAPSKRGGSPKQRGPLGSGLHDTQHISELGHGYRKGQTSTFKSSSRRPSSCQASDPVNSDKMGDSSATEKMKGRAGKKGIFGGGSTKRELRMELMGEATPGPGSYMPASTFGKHAVSKQRQQQRSRPTSSFKSMSLQGRYSTVKIPWHVLVFKARWH